jgi:hypothetical protein
MTPEFNEWWDAEDLLAENPYSPETPIYWAWEGWQAALKTSKWVGLTEAEIGELYRGGWANNLDFARAVEAKLKEKNCG